MSSWRSVTATSTANTASPWAEARGWPTPRATGSRTCSSAPRRPPAPSGSGKIQSLDGLDAEGEALLEDPQAAIAALVAATRMPRPSSCTRPMCRSSHAAKMAASR